MSDYRETIEKQLSEKVEAWKNEESVLLATIAEEEANIKQFHEQLSWDLQSNNITTKTSVVQLKKERSESIRDDAMAKLEAHRATPIYSLQDYNQLAEDISREYLQEVHSLEGDAVELLIQLDVIVDKMKVAGQKAGETAGEIIRANNSVLPGSGTEIRRATMYKPEQLPLMNWKLPRLKQAIAELRKDF